MGNLLSDPSKWTDESGGNPPSYWNGAAYEFLNAYGNTESITATAAAGDTVSVTTTTNAPSDHETTMTVTVNGTAVYTNDLQTVGDANFASNALAAGDVVVIAFETPGLGKVYALDVTLTPTVETCTELGRVTRAYVSGYQRARVHESRLIRGEKRCLVANFNGAIDAGRSIASVTWRCEQPYAAAMSNARVFAREVAVDILAQLPGVSLIKCLVTLDNGEVYTQLFRVQVQDATWFDGEPAVAAGPTSITAP
ncbi:hypothetical protein [Rhodanobacter caeni]|uniref:Uncharacterized protein n=1 Tax=Rhodanobacter caeni TaxID=657654 RepID=A0ABP3EGM8_9GAMM